MGHDISLKSDLTFSAHTINCVCHSIRPIFGVLCIYNFGCRAKSVSSAFMGWLGVQSGPYVDRIFMVAFKER